MKATQEILFNQIDVMRGALRPEDIIEVISLLLLLKHFDKAAMLAIASMGKASQEEALFELIVRAKSKFPEDVLSSPNLSNATASMHLAIDLVAKNEDDLALSKAIRNAINTFNRFAEVSSSQNEQTLISELLSGANANNLFDGAAGMASSASIIDAKAITLRDIQTSAYIIAYRLLTVEGKKFDYTVTNSLIEPTIKVGGYDLIVMTPPFGLRLNNTLEIAKAPYLLPELSTHIPTSASDSLWIQLSLYAMSDRGKAYITLPAGVFFRGGYDAQLREYLVENEFIESIIHLAGGMQDHTLIPTVMLVLNKAKIKGSPIHFVDARQMMVTKNRKHVLMHEKAILIAELAQGLHPQSEHYKAVYLPKIREKKYILNVAHYFEHEEVLVLPDLAKEIDSLNASAKQHEQSQAKLRALLSKHVPIALQ